MFGKKKEKTGGFIHTTKGKVYLKSGSKVINLGHGKVSINGKIHQISYDNVPDVKRGWFKRLLRIK